MNIDPTAIDMLRGVYPRTAQVLDKLVYLLERLPSDADRVRWRDWLGEYVATFAGEHEDLVLKRLQGDARVIGVER